MVHAFLEDHVLAELHSERFVDSAPAAVWATLLDEGRYLVSERTMYVILDVFSPLRRRLEVQQRESGDVATSTFRQT